MNDQISTEIIFTGNQISAIEIFVNTFKFILVNIEENKPLNHYVAASKLKQYVAQHSQMKFGQTVKINEHLSLVRVDRQIKK